LPAYLSTQFVRFQYKERASTNAKILKDIKFPISLDVFELCTPELQDKLLPMRAKFKEQDDQAVTQAAAAAKAGKVNGDEAKHSHPFSFPDDEGSNNSGFYQLQAVLTHKGRSSSSGHYLAWIRRKAGEWFQCDDDDVSLVSEEEILKLSGGGQYLLFRERAAQ
jgi:ubiquitin carboxyl-terminal hydrolase 14